MQIRSYGWLLVLVLIAGTVAGARGQDFVALAAQLTEECKNDAAKDQQVSKALPQVNPETAGRAKDSLQRLADAGSQMETLIEKGIPQKPEEAKAYYEQLKAAQEQHQAARDSVIKAFEKAPNLADHVLNSKFGSERVNEIFNGFNRASTSGSSGPRFDGQVPDESIPEWVNKSLAVQPTPGTQFFQGSPVIVNHNYQLAPPAERENIQRQFNGHIPGGVVLDGTAKGLEPIRKIVFDARSDAFIVNDNAVYFARVPRKAIAAIAEAIAQDDRIGVSLSTPPEIYGALAKDSPITWNLMLADHFLGSIAFGQQEHWLAGYRFAENYRPKEYEGDEAVHAAAFFRFTGVEFQLRDQVYQVTQETFEARSIPLREDDDANGGLLASDSGSIPSEWQENLRHVANNINWYRREKLVDQAFAYAEVAAFLRAVKGQNIDLKNLASQIEAETAIWEALH